MEHSKETLIAFKSNLEHTLPINYKYIIKYKMRSLQKSGTKVFSVSLLTWIKSIKKIFKYALASGYNKIDMCTYLDSTEER